MCSPSSLCVRLVLRLAALSEIHALERARLEQRAALLQIDNETVAGNLAAALADAQAQREALVQAGAGGGEGGSRSMPPPPPQNLLEPPAPPRKLPEAPLKITGAFVEVGEDARKSEAGAAQDERALVAAVAAEGELLHFIQLASERAGERDALAYTLRYEA